MSLFVKGHTPWNKGGSCSEETKEKISSAKVGKKHKPEVQEKINSYLIENGKGTRFAKGSNAWNKGIKNPRLTPEEIKANQKAWRIKNKDARNAYNKQWRDKNSEKVKEIQRKSRQKNAARINKANAEYHANKLMRVPKWLTDDDKWIIKEAYDLAVMRSKLFGFSWHVDHIIPLKGKTVCGLHVPSNIQVIEGHINIRKNNSFEGI